MPRPPSPYGAYRRDPSPFDYMDDHGGRHRDPGARREQRRPRFDEDDNRGGAAGGLRNLFSKLGSLAYSEEDARPPRRSKSYREPRPPRSDDDSPPPRRRRDSPPPRAKPRPSQGYQDDYDDPNPPRRRRPREDEYYSDNRHDRARRDTFDEPPRRRDGYDERPRRREYDDRYDDRPRRRDTYDDRYDDRPRRRDAYDERPRRDRDRYDDRMLRDSRDDRVRRGNKNAPEWQKQAKELFYTHALPVIKKEGSKFVTKQIGQMLSKQGGGR